MKRAKARSLLFTLLLPALLAQLFTPGCSKEKSLNPHSQQFTCDSLFDSFSKDIEPIFSGNCAVSGCHNSSTAQNGIVLEDYSQIRDEAENGTVLCAIKHQSGCTNMPYNEPKLSTERIEKIECWVEAGYPND